MLQESSPPGCPAVVLYRCSMRWEPVNAMIYESATHRVRLVGNRWFAERKARGDEPATKIGNGFEWQVDAERACEADERQRRC